MVHICNVSKMASLSINGTFQIDKFKCIIPIAHVCQKSFYRCIKSLKLWKSTCLSCLCGKVPRMQKKIDDRASAKKIFQLSQWQNKLTLTITFTAVRDLDTVTYLIKSSKKTTLLQQPINTRLMGRIGCMSAPIQLPKQISCYININRFWESLSKSAYASSIVQRSQDATIRSRKHVCPVSGVVQRLQIESRSHTIQVSSNQPV